MSRVENLKRVAHGSLAFLKGQKATKKYLLELARDWRESDGFETGEKYKSYCRQALGTNAQLLIWDTLLAAPAVSLATLALSMTLIKQGVIGSDRDSLAMVGDLALNSYVCSAGLKITYLGARAGFATIRKSRNGVDNRCGNPQEGNTAKAYGTAFVGSLIPFPGLHLMAFPIIALEEHGEFALDTINMMRGNRGVKQNVYDGGDRLSHYGSEYMRAI